METETILLLVAIGAISYFAGKEMERRITDPDGSTIPAGDDVPGVGGRGVLYQCPPWMRNYDYNHTI